MVPLENRISYLNQIKQNTKIYLFWCMLNKEHFNSNIENPNDICSCVIKSIIDSNEQQFRDLYKDYSIRKPVSDSAWVNDDFLIFALIIGIVRYKIDKTWIKSVIKTRTTQKAEYISINNTLSNIIGENFESNDNLFEIIVVFQDLLNLTISTTHIDELYKKISGDTNLFSSQNDFLICFSLKALDAIIKVKGLSDNMKIVKMRDFYSNFPQRVNIISNVFCRFLLILIIVLFFFFWEKENYIINVATGLFGVLGCGFLTFIKRIKKVINKILLNIFGYI